MASLIKPSHVGRLHARLGIPDGQKIPLKRLMSAKAQDSGNAKRQDQFAINFHKGK